jgi:hypothetical protein
MSARRTPRAAQATAAPTSVSPAQRPYRLLSGAQIEQRFAAALRCADGAEGAQCIHELWMRGEYPARVERRIEELWALAAVTIPEWLPMRYVEWLPIAYDLAAGFRAARAGRSNVYLVLLDFADRRRGPYGLYVGATRYAPAQRFEQHKLGIRAAGSVLKRGLEVLTGPTLHLQRIARAEALRIEAQLAHALQDAGLLVEGGH